VLKLFRQLKAINHSVVKRTHAQERLPPRKSARLGELHRNKPAPAGDRRKPKRQNSNSGARRGEVY